MSNELTQARRKLSQIRTLLRQKKVLSAVIALHDALATILKTSLMKQEREEFTDLIDNSIIYLRNDNLLRQLYPLQIKYVPGKEKELLDTIKELQAALEEQEKINAQAQLDSLPKIDPLELGKQYLEDGNLEAALKYLAEIAKKTPDLKGHIGELLLDYKRYPEAYAYLAEALENNPDAYHLYNKIGMTLRKLERYEEAEIYYRKALNYKKDDAYLYFNFGRLYLDWGKWDMAEKLARISLKFQPEFESAHKMLLYAQKKMSEQ